MALTALIPIADGSEDLETVTLIDVLRRANVKVTVASVMPSQTVVCARGTRIIADASIDECGGTSYDLIALPGGLPGAEHLRDSAPLTAMLTAQKEAGRWYAAICASPAVVFAAHGLIDDVTATCYPAMHGDLPCAHTDDVVIHGRCITSQGPGTALVFALELVRLLCGEDAARETGAAMLVAP